MNKKFFIMLLSLVIMASAQLCSAAVPVEGFESSGNTEYWVDKIAERYSEGPSGYWYSNGKSRYPYVVYQFIGGRSAAYYIDQALHIGHICGHFYYENGAFYGDADAGGNALAYLEKPPTGKYIIQDRDTIIYECLDDDAEVRKILSGVYKRMKFNDGTGEYEAFAKYNAKMARDWGYGPDDSGAYNMLRYPFCCALLTFLDRNGDLSGTDF